MLLSLSIVFVLISCNFGYPFGWFVGIWEGTTSNPTSAWFGCQRLKRKTKRETFELKCWKGIAKNLSQIRHIQVG